MLRKDKEAVIAEVAEQLAATDTVFVSDYRGLTVAQLSELRAALRDQRRPLHHRQEHARRHRRRRGPVASSSQSCSSGPTAVTFCGDDAVGAAKALADFARTHPQLEVRGGLLDQSLIDAEGVRALASLPPRDVLVAQVVGTMAAPLSGLVTVLQGTISGFVRALGQVAEQRAAAGEA